MNKPVIEMNPTELLRYQVELLERLVSDKRMTVTDFDVSFVKLFGIFLKALPAALCAYIALAIITAFIAYIL